MIFNIQYQIFLENKAYYGLQMFDFMEYLYN